MQNDLVTYLKQRVGFLQFAGLTLLILLYAKARLEYRAADLIICVLLFCFLVIMRLYDDLQNSARDNNKNRIYCDPEIAAGLRNALLIAILAFTLVFYYFSPVLVRSLFLFFICNHLLYKFTFRYYPFPDFLPLLKYPVIVVLLSFHYNPEQLNNPRLYAIATAFFAVFVLFEICDDPAFFLKQKFAIAVLVLAASLLYFAHLPFVTYNYGWLFLPFFTVLFWRSSFKPYALLVVFLIIHLIMSYEL